jgi:hydrogenase nickel incorporation protein HypA/HybF
VHELSIASAIVEAVQGEVAKRGSAHARRVAVRVGEFSAVDPDSLRFAFDALIRDTPLLDLILEIEVCPLRFRCRDCGECVTASEWIEICPSCGSRGVDRVGGDELDLAYLEMEYESSGDRAQSPQ